MLYNEEESHVAKAAQALLGVFNSRWAQLEADWDAEEAKYAHLLAPAPPAETPAQKAAPEAQTSYEDEGHGREQQLLVAANDGHQQEEQAMASCEATAGDGAMLVTPASRKKLQAGQGAMDLAKMAGGGNALGISEPRRSHVRDALRQLPGRTFPGSSGILGADIASGKQHFLFHGSCKI